MKKLFIIALALALCLGTYALAEERDLSVFPWAEYLPEGAVVEDVEGELELYDDYLDLFDEYTYTNPNTTIGDITYYLYNPIKHGIEPDGEYSVCMWFHGASNSALKKYAAIVVGAAQMPNPEIQQELGGMFVIVPLANENVERWSANYTDALYAIMEEIKAEYDIGGPTLVAGTSMGGLMVNHWLNKHADATDGVFWMATALPAVETVQQYSDMGIKMWFIMGRHDETSFYASNFDENGTEPYERIANLELSILDWVRNANGTISGMCGGGAQGQHCICVHINRNLILEDGTPDDPTHPEGVVAWFRDVIKEKKQ